MRQLSGCKDGPCPKVFETDSGDFLVQGTTATGIGDVPADESVVLIPRAILLETITALDVGA